MGQRLKLSNHNVNNTDIMNALINNVIVKDLKNSIMMQNRLSTYNGTGELFGNMGSTKENGLISEMV